MRRILIPMISPTSLSAFSASIASGFAARAPAPPAGGPSRTRARQALSPFVGGEGSSGASADVPDYASLASHGPVMRRGSFLDILV